MIHHIHYDALLHSPQLEFVLLYCSLAGRHHLFLN